MSKKILSWMLMSALTVSSLTGCGQSSDKQTTSTNQDKQTVAVENIDPMGKYEEPVTVTAILSYGSAPTACPPDLTPETQSFVQLAKDVLNIDVEFLWTAPEDQYAQKLGVAMASGDLPDFMALNATDYELLRESELLMPLNEVLPYASDTLNEWIYRDPNILENVTYDGDVMAIPQYWDGRRGLNFLMIREDWLDELGLEVPETVEEFTHVIRMFKEKKGAEVGIPLTKSLTGYRSVDNVINMFGGYLDAWIDNGQGELIPGEIQPEAKEALGYLNGLYKEGLIHKEFAMHDASKASEFVLTNKTGIIIGPWWMYDAVAGKAMSKNPETRWTQGPLPVQGNGKTILDRVTIEEYNVINANCKNPDAVMKLFNLWVEVNINAAEFGELATEAGGWAWNWVPTTLYDPFDIAEEHKLWNEAIDEANGVFTLETFPEEKLKAEGSAVFLEIWELIPQYYEWKKGTGQWDEKNRLGRMLSRVDVDYGWGETVRIEEAGNFVYDEFFGSSTPTMVQRGSTLTKLTEETFLKIIMGELPLDAFDSYKENWLKLGGQDIITEVNEWYQTVK
ncbi:MAG: extracellular solute-binding protein [Clostridium sp.]